MLETTRATNHTQDPQYRLLRIVAQLFFFQRSPREGAAAVELAILLPFVLALAFAVCDYGRVMHVSVAISNAARAGVEYGCLHGFTDFTESIWRERVEETIRTELESTPSVEQDGLAIEITDEMDEDELAIITVRVRYQFDTILAWPGIPSAVPLTRTFTMRRTR